MTTAWPTDEHETVRARISRHREMDEIIQGVGFNGSKGCAIGCSLDCYDHAEYVRVVGVDMRTARAIDWLHERLPSEQSLDWPGRVANALQPGADTTLVFDRLLLWALEQWGHGNEHLERVTALYRRRCAGADPEAAEWSEAALAALDARAALAALAAIDARAALSAIAALDARAAIAALAARAAIDARAALSAIAALDARAALDALDARVVELADSLENILRTCPMPEAK